MMENYQGDLTDILRASGGGGGGGGNNGKSDESTLASTVHDNNRDEWQQTFLSESDHDFGVPFTHLGDPLILHENADSTVIPVLSAFFHNHHDNSSNNKSVIVEDEEERETMIKRQPKNIFSRMLQISPNGKFPIRSDDHSMNIALPVPPSHDQYLHSSSSFKGCLVPSPAAAAAALQISSPARNTAIKRRKSQAKKVVCIPAPAAPTSSSRPSGEVVPSDLWAWRKYGQKPIKGSPYPRGYYRCSSSKGCSARKQVERSRTDPNMLVITYTSEHNHPWPTQRNALAGSTRSHNHHTKSTTNNTKSTSSSLKMTNQEANASIVKEEEMDLDLDLGEEFDEGSTFPMSYKPALPSHSSNQEDSFFADLGEIEGDTLDLLFAREYSSGGGGDRSTMNKGTSTLTNPFSFYDWATNNTTITTTTNNVAPSYEDKAK